MFVSKSFDILIVEDEFLSAEFISQELENLGHKIVSCVTNAKDAIQIVQNNSVDFIFMDINIEGPIDGIECAKLINKDYTIPIIYITAYNDTQTIGEASDSNIYGYLIKPFDKFDLCATINVATRRVLESIKEQRCLRDIIKISNNNDYIYNINSKTLFIDSKIVSLTNKELKMLHLFCINLNQNVSYELLLDYVWNDRIVVDSTIRDTILRLRKKAPLLNIKNISGVGYCLSV